MQIQDIQARQILDSRGNPTVEVEVTLSDGSIGRASVPSGASTGSHESLELRDQGEAYGGKGVTKAIRFVNNQLKSMIINNDPLNQEGIDNELVLRDATPTLKTYGANAILGISLAVSKAVAISQHMSYFRYINWMYSQMTGTAVQPRLPKPMFNILNGGAHTDWQTTDIQEFMVVPVAAESFAQAVQWGSEIYHALEKVLKKNNYSTTVGDEGGFAPALKDDEEALKMILEAIETAGYQPGKQVGIALDAATSEFFADGKYNLRRQNKVVTSEEIIELWDNWTKQYPIISLEDGLNEDDWTGWQDLSRRLDGRVMIVGDDLLVTNTERIQKAIDMKACDSLLMKVNQIGTLSESLAAIQLAQAANWQIVVSHRSGETEDTSISDIAVGAGCGYIKSGAPARSERTAKYNQLLRIESELLR
jgi:enolase